MKKQLMSAFTALLFSVVFTSVNAQQLKVPAPSPTQTLKQNFGLSEITIEYSRPGVKGRTVFGDLVPYGKIWRTGANNSTKITFGDDVKIGYCIMVSKDNKVLSSSFVKTTRSTFEHFFIEENSGFKLTKNEKGGGNGWWRIP